MEIARRLSLLVTASLLGLAIMLGWVSARPAASANAVRRLSEANTFFDSTIVLEGLGPWSSDGQGASGAAHLGLIESTIRTASDPRAGELAIRLAYQIEA